MSTGIYSPLKVVYHPDRLALLKSGGQPAPVYVQLVLSDLCNQDCAWCAYRQEGYLQNQLFGIEEARGRNNNPSRLVPIEKAYELLEDFTEIGVKALLFTGGGEPTVHPQHREIINRALCLGLDVALNTNGALFSAELAQALVDRARWVRFSVDAATSETYARTRRVHPDVFARVLKNIRELVERRNASGASQLVIGFGFVVDKTNWREVAGAAETARQLGVDNVRMSAAFQSELSDYFEPFLEDAQRLCREAEALAGDGFEVHNLFPARLDDLGFTSPDYSFCGIQHFTTYIGADLNVYRCCVQSYNERGLIGSIREQRFRDLWYSQAKRDDFDNFDARGCRWCMFHDKNRAIKQLLEDDAPHVNFV